jgi:hypothetical protein
MTGPGCAAAASRSENDGAGIDDSQLASLTFSYLISVTLSRD